MADKTGGLIAEKLAGCLPDLGIDSNRTQKALSHNEKYQYIGLLSMKNFAPPKILLREWKGTVI